jgi:hypothetical protein
MPRQRLSRRGIRPAIELDHSIQVAD